MQLQTIGQLSTTLVWKSHFSGMLFLFKVSPIFHLLVIPSKFSKIKDLQFAGSCQPFQLMISFFTFLLRLLPFHFPLNEFYLRHPSFKTYELIVLCANCLFLRELLQVRIQHIQEHHEAQQFQCLPYSK